MEKYYFIEDIKIYCSNSDEEHYDEECVNLFLETLKEKKFFSLGARNFHFPKYKKFFQSRFFLFFKFTKLLLEIGEASWNIKKYRFLKCNEFFQGFRFLKYIKI